MEIQNRIDEALRYNNMKAVELAERTKLSKGAISNWIKQRWQPKQDALNKMAKVLDVSELWLAGYDVPMERPIEQKKMDDLAEIIHKLRRDKRLANTVDILTKLDDEQYIIVEAMINQLKKD